jgi:hypothetical protein
MLDPKKCWSKDHNVTPRDVLLADVARVERPLESFVHIGDICVKDGNYASARVTPTVPYA